MTLVLLHLYDITNTSNTHANEARTVSGFGRLSLALQAIKALNRFTRDTFGVGGIFHGAVEVNGEEWSFGYCPYGTGVRTSRVSRSCLSDAVLNGESRCTLAPRKEIQTTHTGRASRWA